MFHKHIGLIILQYNFIFDFLETSVLLKRNRIYTTVKGSQIGLLNRGFLVMVSWRLKKIFNVSTLRFHEGEEGDRPLGLFSLPPCLTGNAYRDLLRNVLPEVLHDSGLQAGSQLWFMHDVAPPRSLLAFPEFLNNMFLKQWLGKGGPTAWPVRSSDLNPLDIHLWWNLKSTNCATAVGDFRHLQQRTEWVWSDP